MEPTPSTFHSIQMLRAIAAFLVVLFHSHTALSEAGAGTLFDEEQYLFGFGAVGVHIFFVISGFIMVVASRFEPEFSVSQFMRRRLLRIYPVYWICAALYLAFHSFVGDPYNLSAAQIAGALLLWPGVSSSIIGPAWTLVYEMFFYICFALTMWLGLSRGFFVLSGAFICLPILGLVFRPESSAMHVVTNSLLLEFIAGVGIGWLFKRNYLPQWGGELWVGLAIILFLGGAAYGYKTLPSALSWGLPSALLILGVVCLEVKAGAGRVVRIISLLGDSSYSLYLLHILLITILLAGSSMYPLSSPPNAIVASLAVSAICVAVAELFHRKIERPLLYIANPRRDMPSRRVVDQAP
ncbi:acyltransferase [Parafrankia sp. BMG5.11]|uniref:acyltransferase family protein n=1 Tax=Parafrankia sp. BMG5.11 TaxID=222540 RepID=UPI00104049E2|nr:acyltransferase [Parafrankia sp. BMG5.11]TCJ32808.1 acyltransferase [Parafrankia sp. BMG5.11]